MSTTHKAAFAALVLALAACQPAAGPPAVPPAPASGAEAADATAGCNVHVEKTWIDQETPIRRYTVEASTMGPTCNQTVATLAIRAREGSPIYASSHISAQIFGLKDAADPAAMKTALEEWVSNQGGMANTEGLSPWEETDGQPKRREFPFMPESWIDEQYWNTLRSEKLDMFCFVQGGESMRCAVLRDGQMEDIGLQLFPG